VINRCSVWAGKLRRGDDAATLVEYTFMMALIALFCFAALSLLSGGLVGAFRHAISLFH